MLIKDIEGLKFPDDFVTRFFFKEGLDKQNGTVLELGCDTAHNLMMFYQYGWDVVGVDIRKSAIKKAENNFSKCKNEYKLKNAYKFFKKDMVDFIKNVKVRPFDVLLMPSSIDYLTYPRIIELFSLLKRNAILKNNSLVFVRLRTPQDYRYGKGKRCGKNTFRLTFKETNEEGCLMTFLTESKLVGLLESAFKFEYKRIFHCRFDNLQNGFIIPNYNIIFWGKIARLLKK